MAIRFKVTVAYRGSQYSGWQRQGNAHSIQATLEKALHKIHKAPVEIFGSGRTDRKVSALGQVFHFDTHLTMTPNQVKEALNSSLPCDISIVDVIEVNADFHARYHVIKKRYDYVIECGPYNVFEYDSVYQLNRSLDIDKMKEASLLFLGTHDFTSFNATPLSVKKNQQRTIERLDIVIENTKVRLIFEGKGFLRYMIRYISQVLIEVGLHRYTIEDVIRIMDAKSKDACKVNAPAEGLILVKVWYSDEESK